MRTWIPAALLCALFSASSASGLSLLLEGPTTGPLAPGEIGAELPTAGQSITFRVSLDQSVLLNGFDLLLSWDPTELSLLEVTDLTGLDFDTLPGNSGISERIASIELVAVTATDLFDLQFDVISVVPDGAIDFSIVANGSGLAPGSLVLSSPSSAGLLVPEPRLLLLLALTGLACFRFPRNGRSGR